MLPHEIFAQLYHSYPSTFHKHFMPRGQEQVTKFWSKFAKHPSMEGHEIFACRNYKHMALPPNLHGDGVPVVGKGKVWCKLVLTLSWSGCLAEGSSKETCNLIWSVPWKDLFAPIDEYVVTALAMPHLQCHAIDTYHLHICSGVRISPQEWPWGYFGPSLQDHFLELQHLVDWEVAFRRLDWETVLSSENLHLFCFGNDLIMNLYAFALIVCMPYLLGILLLPWLDKEPRPGWPMDTLGSWQGSLEMWITCVEPFSFQGGPETLIPAPFVSVMRQGLSLGRCSSQMLPGSADAGHLPLGLPGKTKAPVAFSRFATWQQWMFNATICMQSTWVQIWWHLPVCCGLPFLWLGPNRLPTIWLSSSNTWKTITEHTVQLQGFLHSILSNISWTRKGSSWKGKLHKWKPLGCLCFTFGRRSITPASPSTSWSWCIWNWMWNAKISWIATKMRSTSAPGHASSLIPHTQLHVMLTFASLVVLVWKDVLCPHFLSTKPVMCICTRRHWCRRIPEGHVSDGTCAPCTWGALWWGGCPKRDVWCH